VIAFSSTGRANDANFALREVFTKSQSEPGEAFYFFIPQKEDGKNQNTYVYDTKLDRLLLLPESKDLISKLEDQGIDPEDWHVFLNEFILDGEASNRLKIIELDDNWVKFTLDGRHIVLPREHMVKDWGQKNFPLGKEIVNKNAALPQDYEPDDLVKIQQKWNFHAPDYPKYLRRYVARVIEQMLQNAEEQGVHIRVFSAYRSYEKQRYLFLNAVSCHGESQDRVAKQGHSEHQLGTTVDLCGLDPETVLSLNFDHTQEGRWLMENAHKFGFFQSYTKENQRLTGYMPEPWHYRFYGEKRN
jgi:LAS superfamily LD-carboxypeptidase LdcB